MTETAAMATSTPTLAKRKPGSIGLPVIGTERRIEELENGVSEVPQGEEGALCITHTAVKESRVIGVNDPYRGESVKAFVVLKEAAQPVSPELAEELTEYCRGRLARYKVPSTIEFIESLPKSAVGKVLRRELKEAEDAKR